MTQQEMLEHLRGGPIPHRMVPDGRLQVMDLSLVPGVWRGTVLDDDGYFVEGGDKPEPVVAEHGISAIVGGVIEPRGKDEEQADAPKLLQGKLPDDFPGLAALDAAGIHTYAQLRNAGDVTKIAGIGEATAAKIDEAMAQ